MCTGQLNVSIYIFSYLLLPVSSSCVFPSTKAREKSIGYGISDLRSPTLGMRRGGNGEIMGREVE